MNCWLQRPLDSVEGCCPGLRSRTWHANMIRNADPPPAPSSSPPYPGTSVLLPRLRSVLSSAGWTPDSKGFAVMMTLERLEPGIGSRTGNVTERPRVSLATLTVSNTRFCWALSERKKHPLLLVSPRGALPESCTQTQNQTQICPKYSCLGKLRKLIQESSLMGRQSAQQQIHS